MRRTMTGSGVLVLGMHRSGTSALTRALVHLGLTAGSPDDLMEPASSNRSGHWELTGLTACNDAVLRAAGGRWSGPPAVLGPVADVDVDLRHQAEALVASLLPEQDWVWKDPRLCLTLPFWADLLGPRPVAVVCVRNPLEVSASLAERNGFSVDYGLALWERYLRGLWSNIAGWPAVVVHYGDTLADPPRAVDQLAGFVERHLGTVVGATAREHATSSLDDGQRHHAVEDGAGLDALSAPQRELLDWSDAMLGTHEALPPPELGHETPGLQLAFDEHARMAAFEDLSLRLRAGVDQLRADLDRQTLFFHQELERRSAEASTLANDVMAARAQLIELQGALDRIRSRPPIRLYLAARRRLTGSGT